MNADELAAALAEAGHEDLAAQVRLRGEASGQVVDMNERLRQAASRRSPQQRALAERFALVPNDDPPTAA